MFADNEGQTPLHKAVQFVSVKMTSWLLFHGANTEIVDRRGQTALDLAISHDYEPILKLFRDFQLTHHVGSDDE